jgi:hypothetical protein
MAAPVLSVAKDASPGFSAVHSILRLFDGTVSTAVFGVEILASQVDER